MNTLKTLLDVSEVKQVAYWRCIGAELVGTMILMFIQALLPLGLGNADFSGNVIRIGIGMGFVVCCLANSLGPISGGHFNPAVTVAMMASFKLSLLKGALYIAAQCIGAIIGAAIAFGVTPADLREGLSATTVHPSVEPWQGMVMELMITFILVLVIFGSTDERNQSSNIIAPLAIGFTVGLDILAAGPYTGASINPARSLGPAVVQGAYFDHHWVYWIGPLSGGMVAAFVYNVLLNPPAKRSFDINPTEKDANSNYEMNKQISSSGDSSNAEGPERRSYANRSYMEHDPTVESE